MRIEIFYKPGVPDGRGGGIAGALPEGLRGHISRVAVADVIITDARAESSVLRSLFVDPVVQDCAIDEPFASRPEWSGFALLAEVAFKPGVTDTLAITAREAISHELGEEAVKGRTVQTAKQVLFWMDRAPSGEDIDAILASLHNPLIQRALAIGSAGWAAGERPLASYPAVHAEAQAACETFDLAAMDDSALEGLSRDRLLALSLPEMRAIKAHFSDPRTAEARKARGLPAEATDVELEMIAQTWSEHCKHKLFNARIIYREGDREETIDSIFKTYIRSVTEELAPRKPFLRSVFTDNAGVIAFDEETLVCIKAETHNSPSALDPYGGAITGIVGVNRDILGTGIGAKPIFNTNVLCFGRPRENREAVPKGVLHPREVMRGVHKGIIDGGNQSGIPTAAGAFLFDESFTGKPLVFCGTGGILPAKVNGEDGWKKRIRPGDLAIMLGGRIGKDGIHGATFSSLELSESSPVTAVQIGDPIIQKKMTDFLLEARDAGLYEGITDNGAGGLSSSLGEMSETSGGVRIDLDSCPLKYPGLAPWEILVSESQERMSLAVAPEKLDAFMALARKRDVEATVVGTFTGDGVIDIRAGGKAVGLLPLEFLHRGLPRIELEARWIPPEERASGAELASVADRKAVFLGILADPNVASKEALVRQYDHEVQALTVGKPFAGEHYDAPADGAVIKPRYSSWKGLTVTHGICPRFGDWDTERMARCAVDEAFRSHVAMGGDPEQASALDNSCWTDPVASPSNPDGPYKAAQLVRACRGLKNACLAYGLPLISGKDSMKNDSTLGGRRVSVRPPLLVTLMGIIGDVRKSLSSDFKAPGELIYLLGSTNGEMGGSAYERFLLDAARDPSAPTGGSVYGPSALGECPDVDLEASMALYRKFHAAAGGRLVRSAHDLSEGGLATAVFESCLGGRAGARIDVGALPGDYESKRNPADAVDRALFSESPGRLLVSVRPEDRERFETTMAGHPCKRIGETTAEPVIAFAAGGKTALSVGLDEAERAFKTPIA